MTAQCSARRRQREGRGAGRIAVAVAISLVPLAVYPASASAGQGGLTQAQAGAVGVVLAWGRNGHGQLGDGTTTDRRLPVSIGLSNVTAIYPGFALRRDGSVWTWGGGNAPNGTPRGSTKPVKVPGLSHIAALAVADAGSVYALRTDGTVLAWGANFNGQLGNGTTTDSTTPVKVIGLSHITAIAAGAESGYALRADGTVWAWGNNVDGELGDATTTNRERPVQVAGLNQVTAIAAAAFSTYAVRADGSVRAWGANFAGELGDGTTANSSTPVQVTGLSKVRTIVARDVSVLALRRDGTVWSWGGNTQGQLGDGTTTGRSTPVHVPGLNNVHALALGQSTGYAVRRNGAAWAWGDNSNGQFGDGTTTTSLTPVALTGLGHVIAFASAFFQSQYVLTDAIPPTARLSVHPSDGRGPLTVTADASASRAGTARIASYTIDLNDGPAGVPSKKKKVTHTYANAGRYELSLLVTDTSGMRAEASAVVTVSDPNVDGTPAISTRSIPGPMFCNHCVAARVTSSGTAPVVITKIAPAAHSVAGIFMNSCPGQLEIGQTCDIGWTDLPGGPDATSADVVIYSNVPGGSTVIHAT